MSLWAAAREDLQRQKRDSVKELFDSRDAGSPTGYWNYRRFLVTVEDPQRDPIAVCRQVVPFQSHHPWWRDHRAEHYKIEQHVGAKIWRVVVGYRLSVIEDEAGQPSVVEPFPPRAKRWRPSRDAWLRVAGIAAAIVYAVGVWVYSSMV